MTLSRLWIFLVAGMASLLVLAACGGSDSTPTPGPTPLPTESGSSAQSTSDIETLARYFVQVAEARELTDANFQNFGSIFQRAWPLRDQLIAALIEAGVGTAFDGALEALENISAPEELRSDHTLLVEATRELQTTDRQAADAVRNSDLVSFVLINTASGQTQSTLFRSLSAGYCSLLENMNPNCKPLDPLPGGEYGSKLDNLVRDFDPRAESLLSFMSFPFSLEPEEMNQLASMQLPELVKLISETRLQVMSLDPPSDLSADHQRLVEFLENVEKLMGQAASSLPNIDVNFLRTAPMQLQEAYCSTKGSFSSDDFKTLVAPLFGPGNAPCGAPPSGPP